MGAHLQSNPLLHDVFGFSPRAEPREKLTGAEKRMCRGAHSEGARARAAERRWGRDAKAARAGLHEF
ncbi:hypothetical protein GPECTOR_107g163 [Gonium pectorale]|uniref:Uncharacterized protein n=1 Tax=Gonium pectorale TaxID=33097 RepID=A0A150FZL4_GONPE|nr:hypothetical protein GPECTOR_107g163 [Gonium pectorale]|eukprot:KXZ43018.1 hypothetical protein GPECTOR_107g163 [Gonium pectorale]